MTSGLKVSAHLCAQASCASKSTQIALISCWISIRPVGTLTKQLSKPSRSTTQSEANRPVTMLSIPARLKRTGKEMRIIVGDGSDPATPDTGLVRLLVRANAIRGQLLADRSLTFEDIAKSEGVVPSYATRLFRLTILAPDIVSAILTGKHPPELTARRLMDDTRLPLDWSEQRRRLGFGSTH